MVDLSDPSAPFDATCLTEYRAPFAVIGEYLLAVDQRNRLVVLDVANPEEISEIGSVELADGLEDIYVGIGPIVAEGDSVFIYWSQEYPIDYLTMVDVRDPSQPTVVGTHQLEPYYTCKDMVVDGDRLYLGGVGIEAFDVSGGGAPQSISSVGVEANCVYQDLAIEYGWLFGVDTNHGNIDFFDVSQGPDPLPAHSIDLPEPITKLNAKGAYAYASGVHDFRILDLAISTSPVEVGRWQSEYPIWSYTVYGNHAYVTVQNVWTDDLVVLDVSVPSAPQVVNVIEGFQGSRSLFRASLRTAAAALSGRLRSRGSHRARAIGSLGSTKA